MNPAIARAFKAETIAFEDGLGKRHRAVDATGADGLEVLCLYEELTAVPSFEFALRERVNRLANFHHPSYGPVRAVERLDQSGSTLAIVSEHVPGVRLSEILADTERRELTLDINAALSLIRQLVPAVAMLHEQAPDVAHGAIAPEHLIVTPNARLVIVDYVLGGALEQLRFSQARCWNELGLALPRSVGLPCFDRRADVTQVGAVALALILGRPLAKDEYPSRIGEVVGSAWATTVGASLEPLPAGVRSWLSRALQLDVRNSFSSCIDASAELEVVLNDSEYIAGPSALEAFLELYHASSDVSKALPPPSAVAAHPVSVGPPAVAAAAPVSTRPATAIPPAVGVRPVVAARPADLVRPAAQPPAPAAAAVVAVRASAPIAPAAPAPPLVNQRPAPPSPIMAPPIVRPPAHPQLEAAGRATPDPSGSMANRLDIPLQPQTDRPREVEFGMPAEEDEPRPRRRRSQRLLAAAIVLIGLAVGGGVGARRYLMSGAGGTRTGTLVVNTNPPGVPVMVDGQPKGATPVTLTLDAGAHTLELLGSDDQRTIPLTVTAGTQVSQYIEMRRAEVRRGQLQVRTEPAGAKVTVDGRLRGVSPLTIDDLTPGPHKVELQNEFRSLTEEVTVEAGATGSLVVPLGAPPAAAPVSGWVSVVAPVEMQLYESGRFIGNSRADRIMVSTGRHDIEIVNEPLQYRTTRSVDVVPGKVAPIKLVWPKGTIALNALPWADVWIDGEKIGETPIGNVSLPIGPHEVVFRHPELGERKYATTITASTPTRLSVDLTKK